jgi:hypothetical protein
VKTRLDVDPELLELVRRADPMLAPRVQLNAELDTESALRLLAPELDRRPGSPHDGSPRRRRLRIAALGAAIAGAVFVAAVASTENDAGVSPARAQTILTHVRDVLVWPPHAIYEEDSVTTFTAHDGATHTVEYHEWLSTSRPYNSRLVVIVNGTVLWEQAFARLRLNLYDPTTNTVYLAPRVAKNQIADAPQWNSALSEVQDLLDGEQPHVRIDPNAVLDGKHAIELTFDGRRFIYWISARTYRPLQTEDRLFRSITRYPIARVLTGSPPSPSPLSLRAQHPNAFVDRSSADYKAAFQRLIHGRGALTGS